MSIKVVLSLCVAFFIGIAISPTYSGNIISCDSFETCPDGVTCSALIVGLESEVSALEARIVELEAEVISRTADFSIGAHLIDAGLDDVKLRHANLSYAWLTRAHLTGADLSYANLSSTELSGADLTGANLTGANLTDVNWSGTTCPDGSNSDFNVPQVCEPLP